MKKIFIAGLLFGAMLLSADASNAQTPRRRPTPTPTPTPSADAEVISRADDLPDDNSRAIPPDPNTLGADRSNVQLLEELGNRIKNLEAQRGNQEPVKKPDPDEKSKRLLLNLDILTRAEQRSESLRRQLFEMIEKENSVKTKLDALDLDLRPEAIERQSALTGSLRPEEVRAMRRKALEAEKNNLQILLGEIQKNRASLEISLQRADALVEKLRIRFEKEIDTDLDDQPNN